MHVRTCVSVIIVTFSSEEYIAKCLEALLTTANDWIHDITVVDNASADRTLAIVRERFPAVAFIANSDNVGFGRGMNQGARRSQSEYLLILNPDTEVGQHAVEELVRFLDYRPQAAACGPAIWSKDGSFQYASRRGFPTPLNSFAFFLRWDRVFPTLRCIAGYQQRYLDIEREMMTDSLSGSCMLIRRGAFEKVGGFDEDYFLYGEDIDLCWKLKHAGYEIWYVPVARVVHAKGASMKHAPVRARHEFYHSMQLFLEKRLQGKYSRFALGIAKCGIQLAERINIRRIGYAREEHDKTIGVTGVWS